MYHKGMFLVHYNTSPDARDVPIDGNTCLRHICRCDTAILAADTCVKNSAEKLKNAVTKNMEIAYKKEELRTKSEV